MHHIVGEYGTGRGRIGQGNVFKRRSQHQIWTRKMQEDKNKPCQHHCAYDKHKFHRSLPLHSLLTEVSVTRPYYYLVWSSILQQGTMRHHHSNTSSVPGCMFCCKWRDGSQMVLHGSISYASHWVRVRDYNSQLGKQELELKAWPAGQMTKWTFFSMLPPGQLDLT